MRKGSIGPLHRVTSMLGGICIASLSCISASAEDPSSTPGPQLPVTRLAGEAPKAREAAALEGRPLYVSIVRREAEARGLPPEVADAVAQVESGYRPDVVGGVGEIGLMQIRPATAAMLGHAGGALALFDPETNARYAVRYLAGAWRLAGGDLCRTLMKYRSGHGEERMTPLSVAYCQRAKTYLASLGSPLADGALPAVTFLPDSGPERETRPPKPRYYLGWRPGKHTPKDVARFWSAHEARIEALSAAVDKRIKARASRLAVRAN